MFQANVPEKTIQQTTGHRSQKALCGAVTGVLTSKDANVSYVGELEEKSSSAVQVVVTSN